MVALVATLKKCGSSIIWKCKCRCGNTTQVSAWNLCSGRIKSCGCLWREKSKTGKLCYRHGFAAVKKGKPSAEYCAYYDMLRRCYVPKCKAYKDYGGRGIVVEDLRWLGKRGFMNFISDVGKKPSKKYSLDRKDNDKGYFKDNCRWATKLEQMNNRRCSKKKKKI